MTLIAGSRLGPYEIVAPLGAGGMGEVYKARDTRLERTVAVKVLPSHLSASPESRQRFEREAKTISQLSHPHICALHDVGREGDVEYLVMEYLEGETLAERLLKGPVPLEQTLRYGTQIADALDKAHRQGIVHRDLKPGNVMLTKAGVKLLDFGLAKALSPTRSSLELTSFPTQAAPVTREGTLLGTVQYMAPEQLEGKEADARSDIFAFGCVLYEMATGKKAFSGATSGVRPDRPDLSCERSRRSLAERRGRQAGVALDRGRFLIGGRPGRGATPRAALACLGGGRGRDARRRRHRLQLAPSAGGGHGTDASDDRSASAHVAHGFLRDFARWPETRLRRNRGRQIDAAPPGPRLRRGPCAARHRNCRKPFLVSRRAVRRFLLAREAPTHRAVDRFH
jgi:Protein kinase domain